MTPQAALTSLTICPVCKERPADTLTGIDETLCDERTALLLGMDGSNGAGGLRSSNGRVTFRGNVKLCAPDSASYKRSVSLRHQGRLLTTWSLYALVAGAVLLALLSLFPTLRQQADLLMATSPLILGAGLLAIGGGMRGVGTYLKQRTTRFLLERHGPTPQSLS